MSAAFLNPCARPANPGLANHSPQDAFLQCWRTQGFDFLPSPYKSAHCARGRASGLYSEIHAIVELGQRRRLTCVTGAKRESKQREIPKGSRTVPPAPGISR